MDNPVLLLVSDSTTVDFSLLDLYPVAIYKTVLLEECEEGHDII